MRSRGNVRDTQREPSKSGVIGLLGAALGMHRDDQARLARLSKLKMGVRVDREGILERDYHTVLNVPTTDGTKHRTAVSQRYYLADALFLVVLEDHDPGLLTEIHDAIHEPHWPLFLGRRAFVPSRPLMSRGHNSELRTGFGLSSHTIDTVLTTHPWLENRADVLYSHHKRTDRTPLRTVVDCDPNDAAAETRYDVPLSFDRAARLFATRTVRVGSIPLTDGLITAEGISCI